MAAPARLNCVRQCHHIHRRPPQAAPSKITSTSSSSSRSTSLAAFANSANDAGDDGAFVIGSSSLSLEEILSRARASLDPEGESGSGDERNNDGDADGDGESKKKRHHQRHRHLLLSGDGRHLGSDVNWKLLLNLESRENDENEKKNLAFREDVGGENLSFSWGYCGGKNISNSSSSRTFPPSSSSSSTSTSWEVDDRGVAKRLELDDHEALLLAAAVRSGWWAREEAGTLLERALVPRRGAGDPPSLRLRLLHGGLDEGNDGGGGRVEATLTLADDISCLPAELATPLCGGRERWRFEDWARWPGARGRAFPVKTTHAAPSGGENEFVLRSVSEFEVEEEEKEEEEEEEEEQEEAEVSSSSAVVVGGGRQAVVVAAAAAVAAAPPSSSPSFSPPSPFSCPFPTDSLRPAGATYSSNPSSSNSAAASSDVPAWWSASGHLLVRPLIDGVPAPGLFLVDSGASGLVIEAEAAEQLGLRSFGELFVAGVAGAVRSRFRRARSLSLGPVELSDPLFMELPVAGVVTGGPSGGKSMRTVGILGHDLFRAAVVTLPRPAGSEKGGGNRGGSSKKSSGSNAAVSTRLRLDDPLSYRAPPSAEGRWCELRFVSNLPHVRATMPAVGEGEGDEIEVDSSSSKKRKKSSSLPPSSAAEEAAKEEGEHERREAAGELAGEEKEHSIMLMVDSGAGGADVMFHSRAAQELGLLEGEGSSARRKSNSTSTSRVVRGVGTGSTSSSSSSSSKESSSDSSNSSSSSSTHLAITATCGSLPWLTLGPVATFGKVRTLAFSPPGGLDLSAYSQGIACADLLSRARVVLDYPRRRIALIPPPGAATAAGSAGVDARAPRRGVPPGKGA